MENVIALILTYTYFSLLFVHDKCTTDCLRRCQPIISLEWILWHVGLVQGKMAEKDIHHITGWLTLSSFCRIDGFMFDFFLMQLGQSYLWSLWMVLPMLFILSHNATSSCHGVSIHRRIRSTMRLMSLAHHCEETTIITVIAFSKPRLSLAYSQQS